MLNLEIQEKITNAENLLNNELSTISNLKITSDDNKRYLMDTLEVLSNNFNSTSVIEEAHMLPQLFKSLNDSLNRVDSNILILKDMENNINSILFTISIQRSNNAVNIDELNNQLNLYNLKKQETKTTLLNNSTYVDRFILSTKALISTLKNDIENSKENTIKIFKENKNNSKSINISSIDNKIIGNSIDEDLNVNLDTNLNIPTANDIPVTILTDINTPLYKTYKVQENDTLLISEKQEKVFLPYTLNELSEFTKDTEKSLDDVIRENFIISLNTFKNPTISRFKEAYNLAKRKSNYSLLKSFRFAVDIMFKYSLNPAIILACKNVDELKDYLNCLKEQKLDLFKPFKIRYEINPMKIQKSILN